MALAWACAALLIDGPPSLLFNAISYGQVLAFIFACINLVIFARVRPLRVAFAYSGVLVVAVIVWWSLISPSNDRNWTPEVAQLPHATIEGDRVVITNVRNFDYRSEMDFTPRWETRSYDLSKINGLDVFLSYWGSPWIAHTVMSWEFSDGQHLAISIETRKEVGEQYSAILGFFRQFELYFVVADERDVVRLRTNFRGEDVYRYRIKDTPAEARALLLEYLQLANNLADHPKWYNAFSHNCTTEIRNIRQSVGRARSWDWRILVNGHLDEFGYETGMIENSLPFAEVKAQARITERAMKTAATDDFSRAIREEYSAQQHSKQDHPTKGKPHQN